MTETIQFKPFKEMHYYGNEFPSLLFTNCSSKDVFDIKRIRAEHDYVKFDFDSNDEYIVQIINQIAIKKKKSKVNSLQGGRKRRTSCGLCSPCMIKENCGKCRTCLNRKKGKQKCLLRRCKLIHQSKYTLNKKPCCVRRGNSQVDFIGIVLFS